LWQISCVSSSERISIIQSQLGAGHSWDTAYNSADVICGTFQVAEPSSSHQQKEVFQSHALLHYSVLKNLAELAEKENNVSRALEYYLEVTCSVSFADADY